MRTMNRMLICHVTYTSSQLRPVRLPFSHHNCSLLDGPNQEAPEQPAQLAVSHHAHLRLFVGTMPSVHLTASTVCPELAKIG